MARGFTKTSHGFRAWVRVASKRDDFNEARTKRFPSSATTQEIKDWRTETKDALRVLLEKRRRRLAELRGGVVSSGFRADAITRYLPAVQAMPTYAQRVKDIQVWVDEFGDRDRSSIKSHEIRAVRDRWLTVGPKRVLRPVNGIRQWIEVPEPLSASSVNHRLRALSNLWTVLDGRHAPNPVREVPEADEPLEIPRAIDYDTIRLILAAMADRGRPEKGKERSLDSLAKVRARVMAWTGITPGELGRIAEAEIAAAVDRGVLHVPARRKGKGAPGRLVPLHDDAVDALKDLLRLKACGPFRSRGVLRAWQTASLKVLGRKTRIYDLRHSFMTAVTQSTNDLGLAGRLGGHKDPRTTARYAQAALLPMLKAGIAATFPKEQKR